MKKVIFFIIAAFFCFTLLWGCGSGIWGTGAPEAYGYVVCLKEDGFIAEIESLGYVYVQYGDPEIKVFDTVIIEFSETDLVPASGSFLTVDGRARNYSYVLQNLKSIRFPDPTKGEPTFG